MVSRAEAAWPGRRRATALLRPDLLAGDEDCAHEDVHPTVSGNGACQRLLVAQGVYWVVNKAVARDPASTRRSCGSGSARPGRPGRPARPARHGREAGTRPDPRGGRRAAAGRRHPGGRIGALGRPEPARRLRDEQLLTRVRAERAASTRPRRPPDPGQHLDTRQPGSAVWSTPFAGRMTACCNTGESWLDRASAAQGLGGDRTRAAVVTRLFDICSMPCGRWPV